MPMPRCLWLFFIASAALYGGSKDTVVVSATAAPGYLRKKLPDGDIIPETYVFSKGRFLSSGTVDRDLERIPFSTITLAAAEALTQQNYLPTTDVKAADLFIVLHWGSTVTYDDPQREFNLEAINSAGGENFVAGDTGALNSALTTNEQSHGSAHSAISSNARLLGYSRALNREKDKMMASNEERLMSEELNEERYFIIVQAFDMPLLRKEHKWRVLWMTRISIRSPGNLFTTALPSLMQAGANVFGQQTDDLVRVQVGEKQGTVKLGELKFLETTEDPPKSAPTK